MNGTLIGETTNLMLVQRASFIVLFEILKISDGVWPPSCKSKNQYIHNLLTNFEEIWYGAAHWPFGLYGLLKCKYKV